MDIYQDLLSQIPEQEFPVRRLIVGCHWTMVSSRFSGLASTLTSGGPHGQHRVREVGQLHEKSANELAQWIVSDHPLEASIGTAALNSLLPVDEDQGVDLNAVDVLAQKGTGKRIAIIGHFPFVERLRGVAKDLWVIEKRPADGDHPEHAALELLPQADIVVITGTALINHTMAGLLGLCSPQALVMVLGPSTPLSPVWFKYGVSILSGIKVVDEEAAALTISQGAIFPQVKGVRLLTFYQ